ncbi:MAG: aldo/keto reductase, partial [Pseudomonadota bacterium]
MAMERRPIGRTGMTTGVVGLGTMTWGRRNSEAEAHAQMDQALDAGIDFLDAAEMYPFPADEAHWGRTEEIVGSWLGKDKSRREKVVVATKIVGRSERFSFLRGGENRLNRKNIEAAIDGSLKRLGVEAIDLYQLHWPDRATNFFGALGYVHTP